MKIEIKKSKKEDMEKEGVTSWPIWEKEVSRFDWHYDSVEECYLLEGKVVVESLFLTCLLYTSPSPRDRS